MSAVERLRASMSLFEKCWPSVVRGIVAVRLGNLTGMAISVSYHRNLTHRAFKLPKWLEYSLAYCAAHAIQGDPIDWVSTHRCHHLYADTGRDPHSPIYGFWFSQMMWFFDSYNLTKKNNVRDLEKQWFYRFMHKTYWLHPLALSVLLFAIGGVPYVIWGMGFVLIELIVVREVRSELACNIYGQFALITFGEGWHNNHHAFEYSARHGHEWWEIDIGWYIIKFLQAIGLATCVKLPSQTQKLAALNKSKPRLS
ncbi:Palmitoyl-monogalactosyldiacylglycerol delta-7 desaturase, chloroplastic, partial [Cucurbita argyrosperma subsp. sororia]